jgi:O-antigen ligase
LNLLNKEINTTKDKFSLLVCLLFIYPFIVTDYLDTFYVRIGTLAIMPILFFYAIFKSKLGALLSIYELRILVCIVFVMSLSIITANNLNLYFDEIKRMLGVIFYVSAVSIFCYSTPKYFYFFFALYLLKIFSLFVYAEINGIEINISSANRLELAGVGANAFGFFSFFAVVSAFLLRQSLIKKRFARISLTIVIVIMVPRCYYFMVLAATRAGFLILTLFVFLYFSFSIFYSSKGLKSGIFLIVVLIFSFFFFGDYIFNNYFKDTPMEERLLSAFGGQGEDNSADDRKNYATMAFNVGLQNPLLGIGSGNFATLTPTNEFSHNSFTEIFANNGVFALFLYLSIYLLLIKEIKFSIRNKTLAREYYAILIPFIFCYFIFEFFYVFYLDQYMLAFFYLIYAFVKMANSRFHQSLVN